MPESHSLSRLLFKNPELRRYTWLEITPARLLLIPFLLLMLLSVINFREFSPRASFLMCYWGFLLITLAAGSFQVAQTIINERLNGTWEWQRLSALSALRLMIGKLAGITLYKWYIGFWLLGTMLYIATTGSGAEGINLAKVGDRAPEVMTFGTTIQLALILLLSTLVSYSLTFFTAGFQSENIQTASRFSSTSVAFLPVIVGYYLASFGYKALTLDTLGSMFPERAGPGVTWYGSIFGASTFHFASMLFFAGWALYGLYHLLQRQLRYHVTVLPFALFLLCFTIYLNGFLPQISAAEARRPELAFMAKSLLSILIAIVTCYALAPIEALQVTKYPLWWADLRQRNWSNLAYSTPLWVVAFSALLLNCLTGTLFAPGGLRFVPGSCHIPLLLFVLRDMLVLHLLVLCVSRKRVTAAFWLFMFLAYFMPPFLFGKMLGTFEESRTIIAFFYPAPTTSASQFLINLLIIGAQCGGLGLWLSQKWQSRQQSLAA